jgi:hypothetical protein
LKLRTKWLWVTQYNFVSHEIQYTLNHFTHGHLIVNVYSYYLHTFWYMVADCGDSIL